MRWLGFLLVLAGCGGASMSTPLPHGSGAIDATMNDVSILFPLPQSKAEVGDLIAASSSGSLGALIPKALYESVGRISGSTCGVGPCLGKDGAEWSDLHAVALRLDPCFASLAPDPHGVGCTPQVRLVFQEVIANDGPASPVDSALHAFYDVSRDDLLDLARAIVAQRGQQPSSGPLATNPVIVAEGLDGPFASTLRAHVLQLVGEKNLVRIAEMNSAEEITNWSFGAFDVSNGAQTSAPFVIPTLPDSGAEQNVSQGEGGGLVVQAMPDTTAPDLTQIDVDDVTSLSTSVQTTAFDALVRMENPADASPSTADCASCHLATPTAVRVAMPILGLDDRTSTLAFTSKRVAASDLSPTQPADEDVLDLHAFSYFRGAVSINQRVVNESAAIVDYLAALPE